MDGRMDERDIIFFLKKNKRKVAKCKIFNTIILILILILIIIKGYYSDHMHN
jgi:hypothetical protein